MIHLLAQAANAPTSSDLSWPAAIVAILSLLATSGLLGAVVKLLHAKARQLEETLNATVEGVERIPDPGARAAAKLSVKKTSFERGVAAPVDEAVKRQTGRTGRPREIE